MNQSLGLISLVVKDYDEALANAFKAKGIEFIRDPKQVDYGTLAIFKDLYGN